MKEVIDRVLLLVALGLSGYAVVTVQHMPAHVEETIRMHNVETWIRGRCVGDSVAKSCDNFKSEAGIKKDADLFKGP